MYPVTSNLYQQFSVTWFSITFHITTSGTQWSRYKRSWYEKDLTLQVENNYTVPIKFSERLVKRNLMPWEMVLAAMLLRAPARPLSRTAAATSASDGATVGAGTPASWRLTSMALRTSSRKAAAWHDGRKSKERNQTEKERKMSKPKKNAKKRNRNQGKIQRYIYRK